MDYTVIQAFTRPALLREVLKHLKNGWTCQGGVSAIYSPGEGVCMYQALVKSEAPHATE